MTVYGYIRVSTDKQRFFYELNEKILLKIRKKCMLMESIWWFFNGEKTRWIKLN